MKLWAVIPSRDRREELEKLTGQLTSEDVRVIVVDNNYDPPYDVEDRNIMVIRDPEDPPNLSHMWNQGFDFAEALARSAGLTEWDVVVLNDDAVLPEGWLLYVTSALRHSNVAVACTDPYGTLTAPLLKTAPDGNIQTRMCPWAFVVRGELGLRADENLRWWWGDTDFDWQACNAGGVLLLPGYTTQNTGANSTTHGVLAEQAGRDGLTFVAKWGWRPW